MQSETKPAPHRCEAKEKITEFAGMVERKEKATKQTGWQAVLSRTESDIEISRAFNRGDVVATIDSDLLIYANIETIWRPVSGGRFLQYRIVEVAASLHLTRPQLMALGIVSTNDYDKISGRLVRLQTTGLHFGQTPYMILREEFKKLEDQYTRNRKEMQETKGYLPVGPPAPATSEGFADVSTTKKTRRQRPRYSFKTRRRHNQHDPPKCLKMYHWKPHSPKTSEQAINESSSSSAKVKAASTAKAKTASKKEPKRTLAAKTKMIHLMDRQHPISTLNVGTARANIRGAVQNDPDLEQEIMQCLQEVCQYAAKAKRTCQILVGVFIEKVVSQDTVSDSDRVLLDLICPRHADAGEGDKKECGETDDDDDKKGSDQVEFLLVLLQYLYSGKCSSTTEFGRAVKSFIERAHALGICPAWNSASAASTHKPPYSARTLLQPVAKELSREFKRHWVAGTDLLAKQLQKNPWRIAPLTSSVQPFFGYSERELLHFFWKSPLLQREIRKLLGPRTYTPALHDAERWLSKQPPGTLITSFLTTVGRGRTRKGPRNYREATTTMEIGKLEAHLEDLGKDSFNVAQYMRKFDNASSEPKPYPYVLRGFVRTDGFRLQLLAYKMKELQMARFKKIPEERLPPRINSTVAGVDYYLSEIRHVIKSPQDVASLFDGCPPDKIKVLALDPGQAYVVGASVWLPEEPSKKKQHHDPSDAQCQKDTMMIPSGYNNIKAAPNPDATPGSETFYNLAVSQRAVSQPTFAFRRWLQTEKDKIPERSSRSVSDIESSLPPLRGQQGSMEKYVAEVEQVQTTLDGFYRDNQVFKKHQWDHSKAKEGEYAIITDRLLKMVGGAIGEKAKPGNPFIIAVGLGDFSSSSGLTSLHSSFKNFFVQKVRSLGARAVTGSSAKLPDVMAAQNMANAVRTYLIHQQRPLYLQPVNADGTYPWMTATPSGTSSTATSNNNSSTGMSSSSTSSSSGHKRKAFLGLPHVAKRT
ncbi:hypothetical protein EC968_003977 [Mortierella alpina]|nr:hypothetical protein EC968_003977 [Mortierella alpina]